MLGSLLKITLSIFFSILENMGLRSFGTEIRYKIIPLFLNLRIPDPGFHLYSVRGLLTLDTHTMHVIAALTRWSYVTGCLVVGYK